MMIWRNSSFLFGVILILVQQALMAVSTYQLGGAGKALVLNNLDLLKDKIIAFFLIALAAYVVSAFIELVAARLKACMWRDYACAVINSVGNQQTYSSAKNRMAIQGWLGSEAPATMDGAISIYYGLISVTSSVVFTLYVFHVLLGGIVTLLIAATILVSYVFVRVGKERIGRWATEIQRRRLQVVNGIDALWSKSLNGNSAMRLEASETFRTRADDYALGCSAYARLEQTVACGPIFIAVIALVSYVIVFPGRESEWGVIIAILPRSLQLFGSVHSMSLYTSKFILYRKKISNLAGFFGSLDQQQFSEQIKHHELLIRDLHTDQLVEPSLFLSQLCGSTVSSGRFLVVGRNGSGKTSLLKTIKSMLPESILLLSDVALFEGEEGLSTGEQRLYQITQALQQNLNVLFLDEWDANLDPWHRNAIDKLLVERANTLLIIEVRHDGDPQHYALKTPLSS
ncbi:MULTISPECIES: ABC transporter ATP-binding protein [unclassified Pseudomonas]|uniref:ATP-binding cassette domain-containing protein n=1 Tax=unclassified Pseudomonas TaxID=196821 RepID=UPI0025DC5CBD|nr:MULTISPECIES: AAA family ATPase [unclassified Pseudomonas]